MGQMYGPGMCTVPSAWDSDTKAKSELPVPLHLSVKLQPCQPVARYQNAFPSSAFPVPAAHQPSHEDEQCIVCAGPGRASGDTAACQASVSAKSSGLVQGARLMREKATNTVCNPSQREARPSQPTQGGEPWLGVSLEE